MAMQMKESRNYPSDRKSPVRLTDREEYAIYKYCVENHCLAQTEDKIAWRVNREQIAKEINIHNMFGGRTIGARHITTAIERIIEWQTMLEKLPAVPIETAELEQLRIYKIKTMKEIEEYKIKLDRVVEDCKNKSIEIERLKKSDAQGQINRIRAIVGV